MPWCKYIGLVAKEKEGEKIIISLCRILNRRGEATWWPSFHDKEIAPAAPLLHSPVFIYNTLRDHTRTTQWRTEKDGTE
jgi:hypothetical protein